MNLADDRELLMMLREANFIGIFVGIESPDPETLVATQKKQNTRRSLADSVHRIYAAGLYVIAGFIVGFDTERSAVADAMIDCIEATGIPVAMVGLLTALPNTQLTRRLTREGRLLPFKAVAGGGDQCTSGLNFVTLRPRRDVLMDFRTILASVYDPAAYFARVRRLGRALDRPRHPSANRLEDRGLRNCAQLARILWVMNVERPDLRCAFLGHDHRLPAPRAAQLRSCADDVGDVPAPRRVRQGADRRPGSADRRTRRRPGAGAAVTAGRVSWIRRVRSTSAD